MGKKALVLWLGVVVAGMALAQAQAQVDVQGGATQGRFTVRGRVYCDTCRCSFETNVTTYIPEAWVKAQCVKREDVTSVVYTSAEVMTDETGAYEIEVEEDHKDELCHVVLVRSPWAHCSVPDPRRRRSPVTLTNSNGLASPIRHANNLGFLMDHTLPVCAPLLHYYLHAYE